MIEIRMDTKRLKLTVQGHATPEEGDGYREICSAASALAQAMVYALTREEEGNLLKAFDYKPDRGDLSVKAYPEDKKEQQLEQIFRLYGYGMELLAQSHPKSVTMVIDGKRIREGQAQ